MPGHRCFFCLSFVLTVVLSFVSFPSIAMAGHAASFQLGNTSYIMDGQERRMDASPCIKDGRIFVPVRYLAYACGITEQNIVYENGVIYLNSGTVVIQMTVGNRVIVVNGLSKFMDVAPVQVHGRTYLPARYIAEALGYTVNWDASTQTISIIKPEGEETNNKPELLSVGKVVEIAQPAVVIIQTSRGQGSGFFWSSDGEIITNAHVVAGSRDITVTTFEGRTYQARIEKLDAYLDIAILRVDGNTFTFIPHYNLEVKCGDEVVALTNPLGLKYSASKGIISAIRDIREVDPDRSGIRILQTDVSVLPGSSGGPLLNMYGEVIGIIFAGKGVGLGLNFALPIDYYFTVSAKPPFGIKDDFLLYRMEEKKWIELHNQFIYPPRLKW
ncbi:trypsin-like peptidase domain-containing protein [Desulfofundulus sp.]|uniref:trypsin-like peptidase domain-containing protein n=1 Tax=Desulfofundulus sp. TaxID=2282750 RepID=UPI003C73DD9B